MGCLISTSDKIHSQSFETLKSGRVYKAKKIVRVEGNWIVELEDGGLVSNNRTLNGPYAIMPGGDCIWETNILKALQKLGLVPASDVKAHIDRIEKRMEEQDREYNIKHLKEAAKALGIELTKVQEAKLK